MSYEVPRALAQAFYDVYATRDADRIAYFLHGDVEWTISGPVDYLTFCGTHRGKTAVLDMIRRQIPLVLRTYRFEPERELVVDGDQAAALSRQCARRTADGAAVSYRVANFMRFRDDKLVQNLTLIDTFDAVEQLLGRTLAAHERRSDQGDLTTV